MSQPEGSDGWCGTPPSTGLGEPDPDLLAWFALRRARDGRVLNLAGRWLDHGRPIPGYLSVTLDALTAAGLLALADTDPVAGRRLAVTDAGQARYQALCRCGRLGNVDIRGVDRS